MITATVQRYLITLYGGSKSLGIHPVQLKKNAPEGHRFKNSTSINPSVLILFEYPMALPNLSSVQHGLDNAGRCGEETRKVSSNIRLRN